jgi:hypothetical protein
MDGSLLLSVSEESGPARPVRPPGLPLFPNKNRSWCKKIRGKPRYFGSVGKDPAGEKAGAWYEREKSFSEAGQDPRALARQMGTGLHFYYALWGIAEQWLA